MEVLTAPISTGTAGLKIAGCRILAGTTSWADRSLVQAGSFYPARTMTARQRLAFYASKLPMTEIATTYRFPPTPEVSRRWVDATPEGFTMDVQAWSLFSGAPTWPESLWPDLQAEVKPSRREGAKLYRHRVPEAVLDECWSRFRHALQPLSGARRLGAVIVRYPSWFRPGPSAYRDLAELSMRLEGFSTAVEVSNHRWFEGDNCEQLWAFLEQLGLGYVCCDGPGQRRPVAATSTMAFVRFPGRRQWAERTEGGREAHAATSVQGVAQAAWWAYRYSDEELAEWLPLLRDLASGCSELHLVLDNCWRSDAVDNAGRLLHLLADAA